MKHHKNAYLVSMVSDDYGVEPRGHGAVPVFVQAWTFREAVEKAAREVVRGNQLYAKLRAVRLRLLRPVGHHLNPSRDFYVSREAVIRHIVAA